VNACALTISPTEERLDPLNSSAVLTKSPENEVNRDGMSPQSSATSGATAAMLSGLNVHNNGGAISRIQAIAQRQMQRAKEKNFVQRVEDLAASARENMAGWSARAQMASVELGYAVGQWGFGIRKGKLVIVKKVENKAVTRPNANLVRRRTGDDGTNKRRPLSADQLQQPTFATNAKYRTSSIRSIFNFRSAAPCSRGDISTRS
jgi:hypothetical protein